MTWNLAQTMSMIKAAQHKYTHRKMIGRDPKTNRIRYRYYYAEHHGGGITSANIEEGSAFKLTFKGRRGHFHVQRVEGDRVFVKHDGRPNAKEVELTKSELRALLKRQHETIENKKREKAQEARRKGRKKPAKKKKTQAPREQMTETAQQGVDPTERGAESVSGLSDEDTKEMDAAVDRFRFTPEEIQNMSLDELSKIREAFGEVFIDHRNRLYETPEYQRLTQAHKEAWAAVPTNEDLRTTEAWAISDEIEALKERFRERHIAPLRELIKPIDERLERLQRNKRAREKRAEKKQRTQEQAARRARREEQARKKREGQARIDQTTARRMLAQDEARKMLGLARKYSATQPPKTTQPTPQRSQTAQAFAGMVDAIKSGEGTQEAQRAFKAELTKVINKTESGTLTDAERAELLPITEQLIEATTGGPRELMTAIRDQIRGSSEDRETAQATDTRTPIARAVDQATPAHTIGYSADPQGRLTISGFIAERYGYTTKKEAVADAKAKGHRVRDIVPVSNRFWTGYAISRIDPVTKERVFFDKTSAEPKAIKVPLADKATHHRRGHLFDEGGDIRTTQRTQGQDFKV